MKMSKKKLLAIALTLTTFLAVFAILRPGVSTEVLDLDDYCWIEGVLHDDTYALYPYAQESIDIGFSKYGEMIGYNEDTGIGLGMQYPGYTGAADEELAPDGTYDQKIGSSVDPFCNEEMPVYLWMNGWFIDIKYVPMTGPKREIWAFALFSDGTQAGGDWIKMPSVSATSSARPLWQEAPPYANPVSSEYDAEPDIPTPDSGGRKTNGDCETEPIEVIYNGPRKFVAICKTGISDGAAPLVDLTFTFIFNKVEKNVIILKDIKWLYEKSSGNIEFGNRGEWDLGISPDTASYVHWYTDEPVQYFNIEPDADPTTISTTEMEDSFEFFKEYFLKRKYPKKWWDEVPASERPTYIYDELTETRRSFPNGRYTNDISWNETQETCYGREWHMDPYIKEHSYAVAQVISKAGDYVGALAVWPHPEFWSAHYIYYTPKHTRGTRGDNPEDLPIMLTPLSRMLEWHDWTCDPKDPESDDLPTGYLENREDVWVKVDDVVDEGGYTMEPLVPFTIYEHDFKLSSTIPAYRIASVYMLTDRHDADDRDAKREDNNEAWSDGKNWIDREIQYQLDEIFNPWDIYDAMHKGTKRWVQFFDSGVEGSTTPWTSANKHAWDGEKYHCIQLDSVRTNLETGKTIPSLPVYPGEEPGVRPPDWDSDHGLCWDAYCAFTERVLVDTGSGYELIPRGVYDDGHGILTEPDDLSPNELDSYNFLDPTPCKTRHYYTIDFNTGRICFYEYGTTEVFEKWYLPKNSVVKVLWSSEHHETTAGQWDSENLEYSDYWKLDPINNVTFRFPLHHDIIPAYKNDTEVFLIEQPPVRLTTTGTPKYKFDKSDSKANITITGTITAGWEIDVKYWNNVTDAWNETKFVSDGSGSQKLELGTASNYTEKVWYHSEKTLIGRDYVFSNATQTLYMQDPVPAGQWLLVNYTIDGTKYADFFLGDGSTNSFVLHHGGTAASVTEYADVGSLNVTNTEILQQIVNDTATPGETPLGIRVPLEECYWKATGDHGTYVNGTWDTFGTWWEEREWLHVTENKTKGNWIIQETSTCDYLVLDQPPLNTTAPPQELKIVFKVPSGRYEWGVVGKVSAAVDSIGAEMVVAAFKNKLIEFGLGGLDITDSVYGPRIPWMRSHVDTDNRNHLFDDWCSYYEPVPDDSWPISSSNIITVGGPYPNMISKYFNDFAQAMIFCNVDGVAGADDGFYAVTCWDKALAGRAGTTSVPSHGPSGFYDGGEVTDRFGHAVISTYKDKNGTIGFMVYGWTGQDTYYAAKWFDEHKFELQHINLHVTDLILRITYKDSDGDPICPPTVGIVEYLGTISEKKTQHDC